MQKTQLLQLIGTLNETEFQQLFDYVSSPIYNKSEKCMQLLKIIEREYPDLQSFKLTKILGEVATTQIHAFDYSVESCSLVSQESVVFGEASAQLSEVFTCLRADIIEELDNDE